MASFKFIHVKSELAPLDQGARKKQIAQVRRHAASVSHKNKRDNARATEWRMFRAQTERRSTKSGHTTIRHEPAQEGEANVDHHSTPTSHVAASTSSSSPAYSYVDPGFGFFRTEVYQLIPHGNNIETLRTLDFCESRVHPSNVS